MADPEKQDVFTKVLLGVASALLTACVVGGIKLYGDIRVLSRDVAQLASDKEADARQDRTDSKHWRWLNHLQRECDALRHAHGMPPGERPDLGTE